MKLGIYTIEKVLFEGEVKEIVATTETGEITVLPNHAPLISRLKKGTVKIIDESGQEKNIDMGKGFLEVKPESNVVILIDAV